MAEKLIDEMYALLNKYYDEKGKQANNNTETKLITKESYIHNKNAKETEVVKVLLRAQTPLAIQFEFNNIEGWSPKSAIHNDFEFIQDQEATLIIEKWVLKKNFKWGEKEWTLHAIT